MSVKARMKVDSILVCATHRFVKMSAVCSSDRESPNYSFSQATPQASLEMTITNPGAFAQFELGKEYDLVFSPAHLPAKAPLELKD